MNAVLASGLGAQREVDAQRRVDQAVQFAVWACRRDTFPTPAEISERFGVSRRTCGRWRKSLALAMGAVPPRRGWLTVESVARADRQRCPLKRDQILAALATSPDLLRLRDGALAKAIIERFGVSRSTALRAIYDARKKQPVDSRGAGP